METELRKNNVFCAKCRLLLGVNVDKTYFQVGNVQLWHETAFSCLCGKPSKFRPTDRFSIKGFDGETRQVLIKLGKKGDKNRGN